MRVSVPREIALGGRFPSKRQAQAEAQRLAFNAICGNGDDHPRNHGVLCAGGRWSLSPAYDIAP